MTVWFVIPTAAPVEQARRCFEAWRDMGYLAAAAFEDGRTLPVNLELHLDEYEGYPATVNKLVQAALSQRDRPSIVVTGGDDVYPDQTKRAEVIEAEFLEHFGGTLGVMQPTGHSNWSQNASKIAWSPWLGREWCGRANRGKGPLCPDYHHLWADRELMVVAQREGVFWARPDLTQRHDTWKKMVPRPPRPAHLEHVSEHMRADARLYGWREAAGFPGSELKT